MRRRSTCLAATWFLAAAIAASPVRAQVPEYVHIDFSQYAESTPITSQYAASGVFFSLGDGPGAPIIAEQGAPAVAFVDDQTDGSMWDAPFGLTDPVGPGGDINAFRPIRIDFDPPVNAVRLYFRCPNNAVDSNAPRLLLHFVNDPDRTVGACHNWNRGNARFASSPDDLITAVEIRFSGTSLGYAICELTATRPPQATTPNKWIRVAQESAPGAGDFATHALGIMRPWQSPPELAPTAAQFYFYGQNQSGRCYGGLITKLHRAASHLLFVDTAEGLSLFVIHDYTSGGCEGNSPASQGHAEMRIRFNQLNGPLLNPVRDDEVSSSADDPADSFVLTQSPPEFTAVSDWDSAPGTTDGFALSGLAGPWSATAAFTELADPATPPFANLNEWLAVSSDGRMLPLSLAADRRVELRRILPGDANCDGRLDNFDIDAFVLALVDAAAYRTAMPTCDPTTADIDRDGRITNFDIDPFVTCLVSGSCD